MQTFLKPFKKLAGRVLLGLKPLALRARGFKPTVIKHSCSFFK
jgi:hypothetical protein